MAITNDINVYRGEDIVLNFQVVCSTTTAENPDVTGWTTCFHLKANAPDAVSLITKTGAIVCSTGGKLSVTLNSTDLTAQTVGIYSYDFWRVDTGALAVLSIGQFNIHWSVLYP